MIRDRRAPFQYYLRQSVHGGRYNIQKMHSTTAGDPRCNVQAKNKSSSANKIPANDSAPIMMAPSSRFTRSSTRIASAKKMRNSNWLKIQPSRVPRAIGKVGEKPPRPQADPLIPLYKTITLRVYIRGMAIFCI